MAAQRSRRSGRAKPINSPPSQPSVTLGTWVIPEGIRDLALGIENHAAVARFSVPVAPLATGAADYRGYASSSDPAFRAHVLTAAVHGSRVHITASTGTVLEETRIAFLSQSGIPTPELVWTMAQMGGLSDDGHFIEGFVRRRSKFAIAVPVAGVSGDRTYQIGPVTIVGDRAYVAALLGNLGDPDHAGRFLGHGAWAIAEATAGTVWEAEFQGTELIGQALDRLAVAAQYSLATNPAGEVIPFVRDSLFANPIALPLVLVVEAHTDAPARRWLRDRSEEIRVVPISAARVSFQSPIYGQFPPFDEAVRAWRRAVLTTDPISAVLALWEAIDFYASGVSVPCLSEEDATALRRALDSVTLSPEQRTRVDDLFGTINEAPLMARLRAALTMDHVPSTDDDLAVLRRLRRQRNDALHGRQRGRPTTNDLDLARGFVNRMIVFWAIGPRLVTTETPLESP
jgi:hypothetical protein